MHRYLLILSSLAICTLCLGYQIDIRQSDRERGIASPTPPPDLTPMGQSDDWNLLFSDDFDGTSLDTSKWTTCYWWDNDGCTNASNNELEWYQPDDVLVSNGTLKLRAQKRTINASDGNTYEYTSGMITSGRDTWERLLPARFAFQYGYAEIRAKAPSGKGLWPAFWMLPDDHNSKPEIDAMEIIGQEPNTIEMHVHYLRSDGSVASSGSSWTGPDFSADWHTFAVDWQPEAIIWYVDGIERWRYTDTLTIPAEPLYLLVNLAVGGDYAGAPDSSTPFPSYYEIDYVRVWSKKSYAHLTPIADAFVESTHPSTNYGSSSSLQADGNPIKISYLKFDSTSLTQETITSAKLRITTTSDPSAGSSSSQNVKLVDDTTWDEGTVTYSDRPSVSSVVIGSISGTSPGTTYEIPLDTSLLQPEVGRVFSLAIDSAGDDGLYFHSKENPSGYPQLIVTIRYYRSLLPLTLKQTHETELDPDDHIN
jgi:beta-glucanase (GH16 family)